MNVCLIFLSVSLSTGIDLILTTQKGSVVPVVIAVNAHDCLHQVTVLESMQPRMSRPAVRTLVYTMLARSQSFVMAGKVVVVVGAGNFGKLYIYKVARQFGVEVVRSIVHFTSVPVKNE